MHVVAAFLRPPAHGVRGHELPFAGDARNLPEPYLRIEQARHGRDGHVVAYLLLDALNADDAQLAVGRLAVPVSLYRAERERAGFDLAHDLSD